MGWRREREGEARGGGFLCVLQHPHRHRHISTKVPKRTADAHTECGSQSIIHVREREGEWNNRIRVGLLDKLSVGMARMLLREYAPVARPPPGHG